MNIKSKHLEIFNTLEYFFKINPLTLFFLKMIYEIKQRGCAFTCSILQHLIIINIIIL